jgi:hypothetical protein
MKTLLSISLGIALIFNNFNCQPADVKKSMVHFDQAFLPVYKYTYEGNMHEAKQAIFYLEFQWQKLRNQHEFAKQDRAWRNAFSQTDDALGSAYFAIDKNDPRLALQHLETAKNALIHLREQYRIDYYPDYLYDFQRAANLVTEVSADQMLCRMGWGELEDMAQAATDAWRDAQHQPVDIALYELDSEKLIQLKDKMQVVSAALDDVHQALESADRVAVAKACKKLEPAYLEVLWMFGSFDASAIHYAQRDTKSQIYSRFQN